MNQNKLEEKLYDLLIKKDEPFVASISGEWGIGKTYFWQKIFLDKYKNELSKKQIAYISLFGYNSLNDIKTSIVLQVSKTSKYAFKLRDKLKSIKGAVFKDEDVNLSLDGGSISAVLSLLTKSDFRDVIICFDDFERLSSKIELKDIMGLISNLKEQKNCQIMIIMNEKELDKLANIDGKKYSEIYKLYKEKIVDYDFIYNTNILEDFDKIHKEYKDTPFIKDFFQEFEISNIRVGKQILGLLKEFDFVVSSNTIHDKIKKEFIFASLSCFVFKVKFGLNYQGYSEVKEYYIESSDDNQKKDDKKEEQIKYIYKFSNDNYESIIWSFLEYEYYDRTQLLELLEKDSKNTKYQEQKDYILEAWRKLHIDFSYKIDDFLDKFENLLKDENIDKILSISDFHYFVEFLKKYRGIDTKIIDDKIKKYIDDLILREKSVSIHESHNIEIVDKHYPHLVKYRDEKKHELLVKTREEELIAKTLNKSINGWGDKDQYILNNVGVEKYKEMIISNPEFVLDIKRFIKKGEEDQYFSQAVKNIKKALDILAVQSRDYKYKVESILNK